MRVNVVVFIEIMYDGSELFIIDTFDNAEDALKRKTEVSNMNDDDVFDLCGGYGKNEPETVWFHVFADIVEV